ncbi:hypothetical protein [Nostoc sp. FACHB-892]|uniref:hypothetical protein n=1 Tax=Nostoc sp. FACHB-892 TaxID=2692843 RepID=UPI0016889550|nr:hypothetical protein [Nostoc sp. FACHB-892]
MTSQEQIRLDAKWHFDNLTGAVKAVPLGAAIGIATTVLFSLLTNGLRVVRGEISAQEAFTSFSKSSMIINRW